MGLHVVFVGCALTIFHRVDALVVLSVSVTLVARMGVAAGRGHPRLRAREETFRESEGRCMRGQTKTKATPEASEASAFGSRCSICGRPAPLRPFASC